METGGIHFVEVSFPHLRAKVKFFDLSVLKGVEIKGSGYTMPMMQDEHGNLEIGVWLEDIKKNIKQIHAMPYIFHEITHAVQYICKERGMDMEEEMEGVAYMVHFLGETLLATK